MSNRQIQLNIFNFGIKIFYLQNSRNILNENYPALSVRIGANGCNRNNQFARGYMAHDLPRV